jgi:anti-sigma regulatory factor (Ser/Thr protein kinase)
MTQTSAPARLLDESFSLPLPLDESRVWFERVAPLIDGVAQNVVDVCYYGFTEMLNNAVDHSGGTRVIIRIVRTAADVEIRITDDGVGIFHKIATELHLDDERHAVLELSKGKLTTAATMHSGQGIFFTSRMFDRFSLTSGDVSLVCRAEERWTLVHGAPGEHPPTPGTVVAMRIDLASHRSMKEVFDRFSAPLEEDYGFIRTQVPVALTRHAEEKLISRSQAKRLLARFDRFKEVVLDFTDVQTVGQAFADEVFRVFAGMHPDIRLTWTGAVPEVEGMIRRALAARSEAGTPAPFLPDARAPAFSAQTASPVSILVLSEDVEDEVVRALARQLLRWLDPRHREAAIDLQRGDGGARAAMRGNLWKSKSAGGHRRVVDLARAIAEKISSPTGYVFIHIDADRRWSERHENPSENLQHYMQGIHLHVERHVDDVLTRHGKMKDKGSVMSRLCLLLPHYDLESWLFQNTVVAKSLCQKHHHGRDVEKFEAWEQDRGMLDEIARPKVGICLGARWNLELASTDFPVQAVYEAGKSFAESANRLKACTPLVAALAATRP